MSSSSLDGHIVKLLHPAILVDAGTAKVTRYVGKRGQPTRRQSLETLHRHGGRIGHKGEQPGLLRLTLRCLIIIFVAAYPRSDRFGKSPDGKIKSKGIHHNDNGRIDGPRDPAPFPTIVIFIAITDHVSILHQLLDLPRTQTEDVREEML